MPANLEFNKIGHYVNKTENKETYIHSLPRII